MDKEKVNSLKLRYDTATDAMIEAEQNVRKITLDFIKTLVKEISPDKLRIDFDDYTDDLDDLYVSISYDGGNHVEYASNMCSCVNAVYIQKNSKGVEEVYVDIEDDSEYEYDRMLTIDIVSIAEALDLIYNFVKDNE